MRKISKFFKWRVELKVSKLDSDARILYLANELLKEAQLSNKAVGMPDVSNDYGNVNLSVYDIGTDYAVLRVGNRKWEISGKPDFKEYYRDGSYYEG